MSETNEHIEPFSKRVYDYLVEYMSLPHIEAMRHAAWIDTLNFDPDRVRGPVTDEPVDVLYRVLEARADDIEDDLASVLRDIQAALDSSLTKARQEVWDTLQNLATGDDPGTQKWARLAQEANPAIEEAGIDVVAIAREFISWHRVNHGV